MEPLKPPNDRFGGADALASQHFHDVPPEMMSTGCPSSRISRYAWSLTQEVVTKTPNCRYRSREIKLEVSRTPELFRKFGVS